MRIPSNNQWTQTNQGTVLGTLHSTFNANLQTPAEFMGAKKSVAFLHENTHTNLTYALAIVYYNSDYIVITSDEAYTFGLTTTTASTISSYPSAVSVNSDAVVCFNRLYISVDTNLSYWDGSSWTNSIETLTTNVPHPMEVFDSLTTFKLAIGNGSSVLLVDSSGNKSSDELLLPNQYRVTTMRYRNGYLYVGTRNIYGGEAKVFIWDGTGANANYEVPVGASWVFAMTPYQSSVACVTDKGQLLYINGSSAQELAALPIYYTPNTRWQDNLGLQLNGKVFNRGIDVVGDSIYMNIDGEVDIGTCNEMKSGLWVYNPNVGLYHYAQASSDKIFADSAFTVSNSEITTAATHYLKTGDAVVFTNITGLTGVTQDQTYYAYVTATNKLKISTSREALQAGVYVTLGGSVTSETLMYAQNRDHGIRNHTSGAIGRIVSQERVPELFAGDIMYGALVDNLDGTNKYTVQILVDSWNITRLETQRIYSNNVTDNWQKYGVFFDGISLDNEKIILKVKTKGKPTKVISGTWLDVDKINTTSTLADAIDVGDEITIVDGYGRGYTAHVVTKSQSSTVYSFNIDESLGTVGQSLSFVSEPYKKVGVYTNVRDYESHIYKILDNLKTNWIQLKAELRGYQPEVHELELTHKVDKSAI